MGEGTFCSFLYLLGPAPSSSFPCCPGEQKVEVGVWDVGEAVGLTRRGPCVGAGPGCGAPGDHLHPVMEEPALLERSPEHSCSVLTVGTITSG